MDMINVLCIWYICISKATLCMYLSRFVLIFFYHLLFLNNWNTPNQHHYIRNTRHIVRNERHSRDLCFWTQYVFVHVSSSSNYMCRPKCYDVPVNTWIWDSVTVYINMDNPVCPYSTFRRRGLDQKSVKNRFMHSTLGV